MNPAITVSRSAKTICWIARIWSIVVIFFCLLIFFEPLSGIFGAIAPVDVFLLSLIGVTLLGLLIAWRWEQVGGIFTLAIMTFGR